MCDLSNFLNAINRLDYDYVSNALISGFNPNIRYSEVGKFTNDLCSEYSTPLMYAVNTNDEKMVALLLSHGTDPNMASPLTFVSPLMIAVSKDLNIVSLLLKYGANINQVDSDSYSALHYAVSHSKDDAVVLLLKNGAKYDIKNGRGRTVLALSLLYKDFHMLRLLLNNGAKFYVAD